jgi:hypothetical protein
VSAGRSWGGGDDVGVRVGCISAVQRAKDQRNRIILKYIKQKQIGNIGFKFPDVNKIIV